MEFSDKDLVFHTLEHTIFEYHAEWHQPVFTTNPDIFRLPTQEEIDYCLDHYGKPTGYVPTEPKPREKATLETIVPLIHKTNAAFNASLLSVICGRTQGYEEMMTYQPVLFELGRRLPSLDFGFLTEAFTEGEKAEIAAFLEECDAAPGEIKAIPLLINEKLQAYMPELYARIFTLLEPPPAVPSLSLPDGSMTAPGHLEPYFPPKPMLGLHEEGYVLCQSFEDDDDEVLMFRVGDEKNPIFADYNLLYQNPEAQICLFKEAKHLFEYCQTFKCLPYYYKAVFPRSRVYLLS